MFKYLSNLFHSTTRPTTRQAVRRSRSGSPSSIEALEDRIAPAGLIDVAFHNGTLQINGDAQNNTLTVYETADGRLTLTTDIGTALRVNGADVSGFLGHTLDGVVTGGITVNLGDGIDALTFNGAGGQDLDLPSFLKVNSGNGSNTITFMQGVTVSGDVTITGGADSDTIHLNDEVNFLGKLTINNGAGGSTLDANTTGEIHVGGVLGVTSGAGLDKIDLNMAQHVTLGGFALKTGTDADGSSTKLGPVKALTVNGNVMVTNGPGNDDLDFGDGSMDTKVTGKVTIAMGAGSNHTDIIGSTSLSIGGALNVTGGVGGDLVHLGLNSGSVSFGNITVNPGLGNNSTIVAGIDLSVFGGITILGASNVDTVQILATNDSIITGAVSASLGAGSNTFEAHADPTHTLSIGKALTVLNTSLTGNNDNIDLRNLKVQGATMIKTGAGNDTASIDDATFNGKFSLLTGAGTDNVNIEQKASLLGYTIFNQSFLVQTGAGDDLVKVSDVLPKAEQKAIFGGTAKFDGGTGTNTLQLFQFVNPFYGLPPVKIGF